MAKHPFLRCLVRAAIRAVVLSAATASGSALIALITWGITRR